VRKVTEGNRFLELFNFRISKFLAIGYIRAIYLLSILGSIVGVGIGTWAIWRVVGNDFAYKVGATIGLSIVVLLYLLLIRVFMEFLISVFYIENHLRSLAGRDSNFEIDS
jgi:Domain of unknown function (DUF4282)